MKEINCTECANHCLLQVEQMGDEIIVTGNRCPRGLKSGREEFLGERVTVTGIVRRADGGEKVPVKTSAPVPKGMVYKVTLALKRLSAEGPVEPGQVICENICGTGTDVIVNK